MSSRMNRAELLKYAEKIYLENRMPTSEEYEAMDLSSVHYPKGHSAESACFNKEHNSRFKEKEVTVRDQAVWLVIYFWASHIEMHTTCMAFIDQHRITDLDAIGVLT